MYHIVMGCQMCQPEFQVGQGVFNCIWVKATDLLVIPTDLNEFKDTSWLMAFYDVRLYVARRLGNFSVTITVMTTGLVGSWDPVGGSLWGLKQFPRGDFYHCRTFHFSVL